MKFVETIFPEAFIIEIEPRSDARGFFARTFCAKEFKSNGLNTNMVQRNLSFSKYKHTLRGMHYQVDGAEEAKIVKCNSGAIMDVIIDIRKDSPNFGKYLSVKLTVENNKMLYVPEGFAHGFLTLEDNTYVSYQVSNFYSPDKEKGIRWNDKKFSIDWKIKEPAVISEKDTNWPDYEL